MTCGLLHCRALRARHVTRVCFVLLSVGAPLALHEKIVWAQQGTPNNPPTPAPPASGSAPDPSPAKPVEENSEPKSAPPPKPAVGAIEGVILMQEGDAPVGGATVSIVGTQLATQTDAEGRFTLEAPPGQYTLRVESTGFRAEQRAIKVAIDSKVTVRIPLALDAMLGDVVVVVGSRTPRSEGETPVPVDVVTAEQLSQTGAAETGRMLSVQAPSYTSTPQTIADGSDHIDPASLRGLGPDQVLVLVNGKRRHHSALLHVNGTFGRGTVGTDLNAIPAASIKRIEVLRDGAASQYGSDAIAGVINIITKDTTDIVDVNAATGITGKGDGARFTASVNSGVKIGEKGFVNFTFGFLERQATDRSGVYTGAVYDNDRAIDDQILASRGLTRADFKMKIGEAAATMGTAAYNMELPVGDNATFYSFGDLTHRFGRANGFYRFPKDTAQIVPEYYPNGFLPRIHTTIDDASVAAGVRGQKSGWNYDVSLKHGFNAIRFNVENSVNSSLGTASPTTFNAGSLKSSETVGDLDLLHKIDTGGAFKALSFVLGSEFRVENYRIEAGDVASWVNGGATYGSPPRPKIPGAQVFPGFQPSNEVNRSRSNIGAYAGLESEIRKGFNVDVGGRFENYSDFGTSVIGKVAARKELFDGIALRAAGSTGFRAPSLPQLWFSNVSTQFVPDATGALQPTQVLTTNNASPVTKAFGIPPLQEEKSINVSGGVVARPLPNLSITADAYYVRIKDRIVLTSQFSSTANAMAAPAASAAVAQLLAPFPAVSAAQFFANAIDTDTRGVDVVADYVLPLGEGTLNLLASANFTETKVANVKVPSSLVNAFAGTESGALETFYFGRLARNRVEDSIPHQRGTAAVRYTLGPISGLVRANYYGSVRYKPDLPVNDEFFAAKALFDLEVGYQLSKHLRLTVGADNVFNTFPDQNKKDANISLGRFIYNRNVSQFGWNGAFYYAKVQLVVF
jgi:iron complex outermembrane recepter protein